MTHHDNAGLVAHCERVGPSLKEIQARELAEITDAERHVARWLSSGSQLSISDGTSSDGSD